jgi:hypothetical protein
MAGSANAAKTLPEHRHYLAEIVKLKLWYLWKRLHAYPAETLGFVLRERVDIYRKTDLNPEGMNPKTLHFEDPRWRVLEKALEALWEETKDDAERFESEGFQIFYPTLEARCERDFLERPYVLDYKSGSLTYDDPQANAPQRVSIHIANARSPGSIFEPVAYLADCLHRVMEGAEREFGAKELQTSTWLNNHPRFLSYFPSCWRDRLSRESEDVRWNFSWWGQFLTARGTFNAKAGEQLRRTGKFPMPPRSSWCTFMELRLHLSPYANANTLIASNPIPICCA